MPSRFLTAPPASRRRPPRWRAFAILIAALALLASACGDDSDVVIVAITRTAVREVLAPTLRGSPAFERWSRPGAFDPAARAAEAVAAVVTPPS